MRLFGRERRSLPGIADQSGAVTVEAAIALAALVVVVVLCLGALLAASMQVRCIDAAREAARLAARGATAQAVPIARQVAPPGAVIDVHEADDRIFATVSARMPVLPMLRLRAEAVAAREPGESQ